MKEEEKTKKKKGKKSAVLWLFGVGVFSVATLLVCQFAFIDNFNSNKTFMDNTTINGIDVSGLTERQAENVVAYNLLNVRDEISLNLSYKDKNWTFAGSDFEIATDIDKKVHEAIEYGQSGNFFEKRKIKNKVKKEGLAFNVSYKSVLGGIDSKIEDVVAEIEQDSAPAEVIFNPDSEQMFDLIPAKNDIKVDKEKLIQEIDEQLTTSKTAQVEIPTTEIVTEVDKEAILSKLGLRSKFSTNYSKSTNNRKNNVKRALNSFNGMVVAPGQKVSFNETTGPRTEENGFKKANIILNGAYVEGVGGGVCQASTTLYNALLLSGIDVVDASHHSLPASYVPLSLDAMVSEGVSDMVFVNNLDNPIYIKTYGTDTEIIVEIYGDKLADGEEIRTRAELVKILPHNGDKIVPDTNEEYSNYIVYKGEYYRVKYPQEGYESKAYVQYLKNGELLNEKEVRHDFYYPQEGIIMEGTEEVTEGITLPENKVKFIPPQIVTEAETMNVRKRVEKNNPPMYNP